MLKFGAQIDLQDKFTITMRKIIKQHEQFQKSASKVRNILQTTFGKPYKAIMQVKDNATRAIKNVGSAIKKVVSVPHQITVKVKDAASRVLDGVKKKVEGIKKLAGGIVLGASGAVAGAGIGIGKAISQGATLEDQMVSIGHFLQVNNTKVKPEDIEKMRDQYIAALRKNAALTPFSDSEVVEAGTRALSIANGSTKNAMELVKLAENMAALTPGKTIMDAMEALADAQMGEMERMKEFGFKAGADQVDAAGGAGNVDFTKLKSVTGKGLTQMFEGGADKLSKTGSGMWSTITGNLGTIFQDMGYNMLMNLKPALEQLMKLLDQYQPQIVNFANMVANGFGFLVQAGLKLSGSMGGTFGKIKSVVMQVWNSTLKPIFETWKTTTKSLLPVYKNVFTTVANTIVQNINKFQPVIKAVQDSFVASSTITRAVIPIIGQVFQTVFPIVADLVGYVSKAISWLVQNVIIPMVPKISTLFKRVWKVVGPILQNLWDIIKLVIDIVSPMFDAVFKPVFEGIVDVIEWAWDIIEPIFEGINKGLGWVKEGLTWVKGKVGGGGKEDDGEPSSSRGSFGDGKKKAIGVQRVPYNNYPILAHQGERLLTKSQAMQMDRKEKQDRQSSGNIAVVKQGLRDVSVVIQSAIIREEADIKKLVHELVAELERVQLGFAG